jgi:hypothetical protein
MSLCRIHFRASLFFDCGLVFGFFFGWDLVAVFNSAEEASALALRILIACWTLESFIPFFELRPARSPLV